MVLLSPPVLTTVSGLASFLQTACGGVSIDLTKPAEKGIITASTEEVGFVPTMGALHVGHLSLIQRARQENQIVVVSIFVNPIQFSPGEDYSRYPRSLEADYALCQQAGVDAVFAPTVESLYPAGTIAPTQVVPPAAMIESLCGRSRPGHFQGVLTIVTKLLHLIQPQRIYFGQKDAQQLALIRRMVADLNFPVQVIGCPIIRESNGLAYSSRNQYLSQEQKQRATLLFQGLQQAEQLFRSGERDATMLKQTVQQILNSDLQIEPEYVELVDPDTLVPLNRIEQVGLLAIAARLGATRLIDNTLLDARKPILAIDGPAGVGKSTVTRLSAEALGLLHLDTGAMYRAATWLVLAAGIDLQDQVAIAELLGQSQIQLLKNPQTQAECVLVNGKDVTQTIRSLTVTAQVSEIAALPAVRQLLVEQQRRYGEKGGIAVEGRDIGTHVFPDAGLKIFLTASVQERARRRHQELQQQGITGISLEQLERDIQERDRKDSHRTYAPLRKAIDAVEINTDRLSIAEVTQEIIRLYQSRCP